MHVDVEGVVDGLDDGELVGVGAVLGVSLGVGWLESVDDGVGSGEPVLLGAGSVEVGVGTTVSGTVVTVTV